MSVLRVWLTAIVLALSNWLATAIVLDVDDPSEYRISAFYPSRCLKCLIACVDTKVLQNQFVMLPPLSHMACKPYTMATRLAVF